MSAKLQLNPSSAPLSAASDVSFVLSRLKTDRPLRVRFENATDGIDAEIIECSSRIDGGWVYVDGEKTLGGRLNLRLSEASDTSVISVYATVEEEINGFWRLSDIAAFAFQVQQGATLPDGDEISVYPPFIETERKAVVRIISEPSSEMRVVINGKSFSIRTDASGSGSYAIRGIDVLSGSAIDSSAVQKFPIRFSKKSDNFLKVYNSGVFLHVVPEMMKALQATNDPEAPACAIFDPEPGPGLQLHTLDEFCFDGSVVGEASVFDKASGYRNSSVGFCTDLNKITDDKNDACRIYNTTSSVLLPNGAALVAFAAQSNDEEDPYAIPSLASRVYVAKMPTSLKHRGNPVRNGTILKPPQFYHSFIVRSVTAGDTFGAEFRIDGGDVFEVRYTATGTDRDSTEEALSAAINAEDGIRLAGITAIKLSDRIDVYSETRFTIVAHTYGPDQSTPASSDFGSRLYSNQTLEMVTDVRALTDIGTHVLFLSPTLGSQTYLIEARSSPDMLRLFVPEGVNNTLGPTIEENMFCKQFVVLDIGNAPETPGLTEINPLPYIVDPQQRDVPTVNPVIAARRDYVNGEMYAYIIAQAPVNNIYQLFFYSFRLSSPPDITGKWVQLTFVGENRNPKASCDGLGNLHITWESDRNGSAQIYYGLLGPSSRILSNQSLVCAVDKEAEGVSSDSIIAIGDPLALQGKDDWYRLIGNSGAVSVVSGQQIVVEGNAKDDVALAVFAMNKDEHDELFNGQWGHLSYQASFDLSLVGLPNEVLSDMDVDNLYDTWRSQFTPSGDNIYVKSWNQFSIDRFDRYFEKIIPVCGSYKIDGMTDILESSLTLTPGGAEVPGFSTSPPVRYASVSEKAKLAHRPTVRHFVLGIIPEKVRFKAANKESFFKYCERVQTTTEDCDSYIPFIENVYYTGRAKLCLLLSTSEDESTGKIAEKKFHVIRLFGDYIDFVNANSRNIKIAVHYVRATSDEIDARLARDRFAIEQNYRFFGDIIVTVDDKSQIGQSFIADFSDQVHRFDIALGIPAGGQYLTNEFLPFNGNEYDDIDVRMIYSNVAIGPHSIRPANEYSSFSLFDRNTLSMVIPAAGPLNLVSNGDFELAALHPGKFLAMSQEDQSLYNWQIGGGINYVQDLFSASRNERSVWLKFISPSAHSFFETDAESWVAIIPYNGDAYGGVAGTSQTPTQTIHDSGDDGYIYVQDATNGILYWEAPPKFRGNQITSLDGVIHIRLRTASIATPFDEWRDVMIEGTNGTLLAIDTINPAEDEWTDITVPLRENVGWKTNQVSGLSITGVWTDSTRSEIQGVLGSIKRILIRSDYAQGLGELQYLDTVAFVRESSISQSFNTTPNEEYVVNFDLSAVPVLDAYGTVKSVRVSAAGQSTRFDFDIADHGLESIDDLDKSIDMKWKTKTFRFTAAAEQTTLKFINETGLSEFTCCIDNVNVFKASEMIDELRSNTTYDELLLDPEEFYLNYSLTATNGMSQMPVTLPSDEINKSCDVFVDSLDKVHVAWESNRDKDWEIYYSGNRDRSLPFRFETRITDVRANSLQPSVGVDSKGRRLISWHDNRDGLFQIYAAINKTIDPEWVDRCALDEADQAIRDFAEHADPYDPYNAIAEMVGCQVVFDFQVPASAVYHFSLSFYEDAQKTSLLKTVYSRDDIAGWRVDDLQISYQGAFLTQGTVVPVTYDVSREDNLSGRLCHVSIKYSTHRGSDVVDEVPSSRVKFLPASPQIDVSGGQDESDTEVTAFVEFRGQSPIALTEEGPDYFLSELPGSTFVAMDFPPGLKSLPGVSHGQDISVTYVHWDPVGDAGTDGRTIGDIVIKFQEPIVAILWRDEDLDETDQYFAIPGATYSPPGEFSRGLEFASAWDNFSISEDRLTLNVHLFITFQNVDDFRVITSPRTDIAGATDFLFYCPFEQASRCVANINYTNTAAETQQVHFRVTAYADPDKNAVALSAFSLLNSNNWTIDSDEFPASGIVVQQDQSVSVIYDPEVLPFESFDAQNTNNGQQTLLCGVPYYMAMDAYINQGFVELGTSTFICPCAYNNATSGRRDEDSFSWNCSGQGKSDIRVTGTDRPAIRSAVAVGGNDLFYIAWQDYRYSGVQATQPPLSQDLFFAVYDSGKDRMYSSGQGDFDRRITYADEDNVIPYDIDVLVDQFQNLVVSFHDGKSAYAKACSLGCKYDPFNPDKVHPCMFTDGTFTNAYFVVGGAPDRDVEQYQKIRVHRDWVSFSTYKDLNTPIGVVNDCFIGLDIIGVPGTYAYRLRNENDDDWTEWLPIGPDLPAQDTDGDGAAAERSFFRAYFVDKERFVAPWVASSGNGLKRVCCEVLTYFGKTSQFCCEFMSIYEDINYHVDFFFDADFAKPVPLFKSYPVASTKKTPAAIEENNLVSITEPTESVSEIFVRVKFDDPARINKIEEMKTLDRFSHLGGMTIDVIQQGINDSEGLPLEKVSDGIYRASFPIELSDGVVNADGLSIVVVNIPGHCKTTSKTDVALRLASLFKGSLDQRVTVFNDLTVFRDQYSEDDTRGSFGSSDYYQLRSFGSGLGGSGSTGWFGGSKGGQEDIIQEPDGGSSSGGGAG